LKPLAVLDLETTGTGSKADRIVEIGVLKHIPDGQGESRPGIRDEDVAGEPALNSYAKGLARPGRV
jgi:DNA polymerase III epsilon subunit-like protein